MPCLRRFPEPVTGPCGDRIDFFETGRAGAGEACRSPMVSALDRWVRRTDLRRSFMQEGPAEEGGAGPWALRPQSTV